MNTREATHKQILENKEINDLIKIVGLTYKKKYESMDDLKALRYIIILSKLGYIILRKKKS